MRKTRHISGSLQKQLLIYMILIALIPALFLLFWYFDYVRSSTAMQLEQDNGRMLAHAVDKLDVVAEQVNEFVLWISQNEQIDVLLNRTENDLQYDETMHSAMEQLREQIYYRPIAQELSALYILGANGLDLRCGPDSSLIDPAQLEQAIRSVPEGQNWGFQIDIPGGLSAEPNAIFYRYAVSGTADGGTKGYIILLFTPAILQEELESLLTEATDSLALYNRNGDMLFHFEQEDSAQDGLQLQAQSQRTQWQLDLRVSVPGESEQFRVALLSILAFIVIILLLIILLAVYLSHNLAAPVERIAGQVSRIAKGDFSQSVSIEGDSEISRLGEDINRMSADIQRLIREKEEKQQLEMRLLQNQMNPHFLYNTLSSIRLMAGLQGKNSVAEMIEALGKLLRANLSGSQELIPLAEEMELLSSYIYIQNIRLKGNIDYQTEVPDALQSILVPKFILQPLAENAILHGIGGRPEGGMIRVNVCREDAMLHISVCDDGSGIAPDRLNQMKQELDQATPSQVLGREKGIGLYNVICRLRLQWGQACRLALAPQQPGICVTLIFPAVEEKP